ncbi:SRPBCC family protein [Streptomyces sp. NPDC046316]|uniref:SRPBCC family protein n=1 Tax=Streptomyces sp. NPDC046316 TaxID=3154494 RepID=UPI0033EDF5A4
MQLDHSFTVPADLDEAWKLFQDLDRVAPCMPGAVLDTLDGDSFTGRVKVKVGAVQMSYRGEGTVTRDAAAHSMLLDLSGSETRGAGTASATVTATLAAVPAGTLVRVRTDLDITGRPAQFGRGIMTEVGDRIVQQFATRLEELLRDPWAATSTASLVSVASAAGTAGTASTAETLRGGRAPEPEAIDLGAAALPVLLRKAVAPAAAVLFAVVVVQALRRRSRG